MICNVLQEYIEITKNEINDYMKLIFENQYLKRISDKYIDAYLNVRFYNFYPKDDKLTFRKNFLNAIKQAEQKILLEDPDDKKLIENMGLFYYYILYFDKISYRVDIEDTIEKLYRLRKKVIKKDNLDFKKNFYETYQTYVNKKGSFISQFDDNEFFLKITDYPGASNIHKAILQYNIKFPIIYSQIAIQRTFDSGLTSEDKLAIEYSLISAEIIKDLLKGNFKRRYIVEFEDTLLKKPKKIKSLLNIVNNLAVQDKICLKIKYKGFSENKEEVYELMRQGFEFAIIIDDTMDVNFSTMERLNAFSYILISKNLKHYDEIMEDKVILNNIIEI